MKNLINYYYNLYPDKIYEGKYFYINDTKFIICKYERDLKELDELVIISNELYNHNINVSTFIMTIGKEFYATYEEEKYVLLKVNNYIDKEINYKEIIKFNNLLTSKIDKLKNLPWEISWARTVDMIEDTLKDFNKEFQSIQDKIHYYIGMAENAIMYVNSSKERKKDLREDYVLSHKRVFKNMKYEDFLNPLNFIFDIEIRDISLYVQNSFFDNTFEIDEFEELLDEKKYNKYLIELLYSRLLYPLYIFDEMLLVINGVKEEKILNKYYDRTEEYEIFLNDIYKIIKKRYLIEPIDWLNK